MPSKSFQWNLERKEAINICEDRAYISMPEVAGEMDLVHVLASCNMSTECCTCAQNAALEELRWKLIKTTYQ